jgi:uncharacterized protein YjbI with pentapeptide repeats
VRYSSEKPPGYKPPESAEELLERYEAGERYFEKAALAGADLANATLNGANFTHADLSGANLHRTCLKYAHLLGTALAQAVLTDAFIDSANFALASLDSANLNGVSANYAIFFCANLRCAGLERADLLGADLTQANLIDAILCHANLTDTDFADATLTRANFGGATLDHTGLSNVDLGSLCEALPSVRHEGPCTVDHRSIIRSVSSPHLKVFLVRVGMPDALADYTIAFAKSVEGSIFKMMRSTFISYGAPDEAFAKKLYEELHRNGVTTFLFSEHAEPGERLHRMMRRGVNEHDRVVLICSKASLGRRGVLNEIEETLAREARKGGETYLIPIRLDGHVFSKAFKKKSPEIAQVLTDRVVADFEGADKDDAKFTRELGKLLMVLRKPRPAGAHDLGEF